MRRITTLLLDCDGVTQANPTFRAALARMAGPADPTVLREGLFACERPFLVRRDGFREALTAFLARFDAEHGTTLDVDEVLAAWNATQPVPQVLAVVDAVRAGGVRVHLATNQQGVRGEHMKANLPYAQHTDGAFFSHELGVAKPSPHFFTTILDRLQVAASETLFVDDVLANVEGARAAGLHAEQLTALCDADLLAEVLRRYGVLA